MKTFYFVGGPRPGQAGEFLRRLEQIGRPPAGWQICPHVAGDGQALHVVTVASAQEIIDYLAQFSDIYAHSEIVEVRLSVP
jgi:hypothetical protein